jgi:prolyl-tRNA synthetase
MKLSTYLLATLKETPSDAELVSHQLMLRAGLIRRISSGLYTWLPLGLRVLQKVEAIIRDELDRAGAHELLMPCVQPAELWQESDRWDEFGPQLLKMNDRHQRPFCFGPTHEEVITSLIRNEINSYKALPLNLYQIQTKFRDEIRPRFGVMRSREFIMKDAYSFHASRQSLDETYQAMHQAYSQIFTRLGLEFRAVLADTGAIGGSDSHEFQVLAESGEDEIFYSDQSTYAANIEKATYLTPEFSNQDRDLENALEIIDTPNVKTIETLCEFLSCEKDTTVKTLMVAGSEDPIVALVLRGCDTLNPLLAEKHPLVKSPLTFVDEDCVVKEVGAHFGSLGPVKLSLPVLVDYSARALMNFSCGANQDDKHYVNANWQRDCGDIDCTHLREVRVGDQSPDGEGLLKSCRGIEVGHIFKLGTKYAKAMNATVLNEQGKATPLEMGCYGIGVSRIVAACIEQHHDDRGIVWPDSMAPYQVIITPMNFHKSEQVREESLKLYQTLLDHKIDVILDDRNERAGVLFKDAELIGIPKQVIIGERGLNNQLVEFKERRLGDKQEVPLDKILSLLLES